MEAPVAPRPRRSFLRFILLLFFLVAVFFAGWVPATLEARRAKEELTARELDLRLANLHRRLGVAAGEARRSNFGVAGQEAAQFFDDTQRLLAQEPLTEQPRLRVALSSYAARRDEVATALALNDPQAAQLLGDLFLAFDGVLRRGQ